jgi:D-alanine-D-alanine ligase-like ATP-grasp enzyme
LATVVLKKTALKQGLVGNALAVKRTFEPRVAELAEAAVRALGLEGPIDIDIRNSANGEPFILEINARVGANVCSAEEVLTAMIDSWRAQA